MLPTYANGLEYVNKLVLDVKLQKYEIAVKTNASVKEIGADYVKYAIDGEEFCDNTDCVVVSTGQKPNVPAVINELKEAGIQVIKLGDAESVGKIFNAVAEGFHKAHDLYF